MRPRYIPRQSMKLERCGWSTPCTCHMVAPSGLRSGLVSRSPVLLLTASEGDNWPAGGEIDIIEGINNQQTNQIALHASSSACNADPNAEMTGTVSTVTCDQNQNSGTGCAVTDPDTKSYGADFASAGGGVYVTEFAEDGIRIWFFSVSLRSSGIVTDNSVRTSPAPCLSAQIRLTLAHWVPLLRTTLRRHVTLGNFSDVSHAVEPC